ncbi:BTB/POZ and MATH domain-containing protein 3-like [Syzygium oleosum]|uniref:BTB/POZ and MATH domain-containing protein 3-like n=1 Tax=Syzygium oleosum TaxID=219896 RepID=UPI0011D1A3D2|nr:BTB/POZ and MATH domain-containing protein 3-like [Syzygium oleosum]
MTAGHDECDSRVVFNAVNGSCTFAIPNFSQAQCLAVGQFLASEVFAAGGYNWAIRFYPGGRNPADSDYSSVYVELMSEASDVRALFMLRLEDQSGNDNHLVFTHFDYSLVNGPYTIMYGNMWGYRRFLKRDHPDASHYIKDDCLTLQCTVGVVKARLEGPRRYRVAVPPSDMGRGLNALLDSGLGTDINFVVGDEIFKAHKMILAARSPVFRAQFFGPVGDRNIKQLVVEDVDPSIFKAMLEFIYTDEFPDVGEIAGSTSRFASTNVVLHLVAAADRYGLNRLRLLCESKLGKQITIVTVATILALADQHQFPNLKAMCLKFATNPANLRAVTESEGFKHLEGSCPSVLSELLLAVSDQHSR